MGESRKTSLAHSLVNMLVVPLTEKTYKEKGNQNTEDHENRQRQRSILQEFIDIFYDEENKPGDTSSVITTQNTTAESQHEVKKTEMFLKVQHLDRDRKKSLLMRVIDGLLSRSDQEKLSAGMIEDQVAVDNPNEKYTGKNHRRIEGLHMVEKETNNSGSKRKVDTDKDGQEKRELEICQEAITTSHAAKSRQRRSGVVSIKNDGKLGVPNLGFAFEYEKSEESDKDCPRDTSEAPKPKRSVTFSLSECHVPSLIDGDEAGKNFKINEFIEKRTTVAERSLGRKDKGIDSAEDRNDPSASEDKHEVLGLSPSIHPSKKRPHKAVKDWLRDPNLYKVCQLVASSC